MAWEIVYHRTADGRVPALDFLIDECPPSVEADLLAALAAVADAPPPAFAGGGRWEAMHGAMGGYYEVRTTGPGRRHYRLFCLLERVDRVDDRGLERSAIAVITGMWKPNATLFTDAGQREGVFHRLPAGGDARGARRVAADLVAKLCVGLCHRHVFPFEPIDVHALDARWTPKRLYGVNIDNTNPR